jgi:DNA-binding winged-HTH domains
MADEEGCFYEFGPYRFDSRDRVLTRGGERVTLQPKQADLLGYLLKHAGRLLDKKRILDEVWRASVSEGALSVAMHGLRAKLGHQADGKVYIETIPWRGYRFLAPVRRVSTADSDPEHDLVAKTTESVGKGVLSSVDTPPAASIASAPVSPSALPRSRTFARYAGLAAGLGAVAVAVLAFRAPSALPAPRVLRVTQLTDDRRPKGGGLFTDGSNLYFDEGVTVGLALVSMPVQGREATPVSTPFRFSMTGISSVRRELLGGRVSGNAFDAGDKELFALPLGGGPPRRVGDIMASGAVFSPDGEWIAYARKEGLYLAHSDGSEPHRLATVPGQAQTIRWSPDGKTLRFCLSALDPRHKDTRLQSLWEVGSDGTNLHRMLADWSGKHDGCACVGWTADGKYFMFLTNGDRKSDLWALDERRSLFQETPKEPLLMNADLQSWNPMTSSPDGKRFYAIGNQVRPELVRYDSNLRTFIPYLGGRSATWAVFSRDRQWVAYINLPDQTIWRARADGSEARQITFAPMKAGGLTWSPDGKWIAFRGWQPAGIWKIYIVSPGGGPPEPLIPSGLKPADMDEGIPTWSPDGARVAFGEVPLVFARATGKEVIHVYDLAKRRLSSLPGSEGLWTPRWSPDRRFICALTIKEQKLMLFDLTTAKWRPLNVLPVDNPTWSSDGRYVYFNTMEVGDPALFRVSIPGGALERLANLDDYSMVQGWSGVAPDNSPLMVRNRSAEEVYALDLMLP